ncbi:GUN4 domain-containing protein [Aerosakkonemataceae cyanobacterium BLCC-F154]|uniref:GUN4 domain-containing protein n=1 Tax=Floridaenema fluviatile BLCC-F154 TaxID=3153640 RepID=A0ABV4YJ90_9CYAN
MIWPKGKNLHGNRYIIESKLGEGGFGITYLAKNRKGEFVVIKTLKDEVMTNPDFADFREKYQHNFRDEALRIALCRHPHIVQIDNAFNDESLPCIAMEYVAGEDLWKRVKNRGCLSEAEALRYIRQIGEALTVVHDKGLLHRDLKPQNIMVRSPQSPLNKGGEEAVLIDFGIAREFIPNLTQTHTWAGTPGFTPLEQYDEQERRGEFTDVYALAATLYCLLTAKTPPPSPNRVVRDSLVIPNNVSDLVRNGILEGMKLQAEKRPQSVTEWLRLFESDSDDLSSDSSDKGVDYQRLRDLLKAGNWREADLETAKVMLKVAGREKEGWLDVEHIENFPCTDLRTIDRLWVKYSNGRFGFSVQKRIWESVGGKPGVSDWEIYKKFADRVGWYEMKKDNWKSYEDLTFSLNAPGGHLPARLVLSRPWLRRISSLLSRRDL